MKLPYLRITALLLAVFSQSVFAGQVSLKGRLLEKGTRKPLAGYSVFVLPHKLKAVTGADGSFEVTGEIPGEFEGPFSWVVNATDYQRLDQGDAADDAGERTLFLERASYQLYETTIVGHEDKRHDSSKSLSQAEFLQAPGSGGDPVKAVSNLPGINRSISFSSQVLIQGSGPQDTKYSLDGHEIPLVFHFGGLTSVVIPEAIERVDTLFAGFGPEQGRATGGWIGLWTRRPQTDRVHGLVFADLFTAGGLVEGPLGEGADGKPGGFLVSIRQSYIGQVLRAALKTNSDFNLTVAPEYRDATALYETALTERDEFKTTFHISEDSLGFLLAEPVKTDPSIRGGFSSSTAFFRLIPQVTHKHGANTVSRWSLGLGKDWISFVNAENYFNLQSVAVTARGEVETSFMKEWKSIFGLDNRHRWSKVELSLPNFYTQGGVEEAYISPPNRLQISWLKKFYRTKWPSNTWFSPGAPPPGSAASRQHRADGPRLMATSLGMTSGRRSDGDSAGTLSAVIDSATSDDRFTVDRPDIWPAASGTHHAPIASDTPPAGPSQRPRSLANWPGLKLPS